MKKLSEINETLWGGMVKRSSGDVGRKEDWMNTLKRCEFYDWLKKNYVTYYGRNIILGREGDKILVPITGQRSPLYMYLIYDNDKLVDIFYYSTNKSLSISLSDKFDVRYDDKGLTHITSGDGKVDNETVMEIIDTLSDLVTRPAIVRKDGINETHWGGMVKRSSGAVVRKQDELDDDTRRCLDDYIEGFITLCCDGYDVMEPTFDEFMEYINNGKGEGDDEYIDTLLKYVPYNWDKGENIESRILNGVK